MAKRCILVNIGPGAVRLVVGVWVGAFCTGVSLFDVEPTGVTIIPIVTPFLGVGRSVCPRGGVSAVWAWWGNVVRVGPR